MHLSTTRPSPPLRRISIPRRSPRPAFTLTELLVVIAIIAVLAGLVSVAVVRALDTAKQTRIKTELDQLDMALKSYKEKYGSYPPCDLRMSNQNAVKSHVARVFPRYYNLANVMTDIGNYVDTTHFRPDEALVFWLGGFNPDPTQPFLNLNNLATLPRAQRTAPFFNFDQTRLTLMKASTTSTPMAATECPVYFPTGSKKSVPYVYFDYATMAPLIGSTTVFWWFDGTNQQIPSLASAGVCMPYLADPPVGGMVGLDGFQIVSAGMDDVYGVVGSYTLMSQPPQRSYPSGTGYDSSTNLADADNVTNFATRSRLGDAQ